MPTILLTGRITALQPITVSVPNENAISKHVHMMPRFDANGTRQNLPTLPGYNIKGALRSSAGLRTLAEIYGADPTDPMTWGVLDIKQVYTFGSGGLVSAEKQSAEDLLKARDNRERDVVNSTFGSMKMKMKSRLEVDHAQPDPSVFNPVQVRDRAYSARRDVYRGEPSLLNRHSEEEIEAYEEALADNKELSAVRQRIKDINNEIRKAQAGKARGTPDTSEIQDLRTKLEEAEKEKRKMLSKGAESIGRPLDPLEYIAPGVVLKHGMRLINASPREVGFFLKCLENFQYDCRFGGHASTGFGQSELVYDITVVEGGKKTPAGTIRIAPYEYELDSDHPAIAEAQSAFLAAVADKEKHFDLTLGQD